MIRFLKDRFSEGEKTRTYYTTYSVLVIREGNQGIFVLRHTVGLKAYVSEEILNWHSLSLSTDLCIHFYCLSQLRQASQRKMIQSSALRLRL